MSGTSKTWHLPVFYLEPILSLCPEEAGGSSTPTTSQRRATFGRKFIILGYGVLVKCEMWNGHNGQTDDLLLA